MDDFAKLYARFDAIIQSLSATQRRKLSRDIAQKLRAAQQKQISAQLNPDGTKFQPRKLRAKGGRIRRTMFSRVRLAKWLKTESTPDKAIVAFANQVQRIVQVHHYGLRDKVFRDRDLTAKYPERKLLGFNDNTVDLVRDLTVDHIANS